MAFDACDIDRDGYHNETECRMFQKMMYDRALGLGLKPQCLSKETVHNTFSLLVLIDPTTKDTYSVVDYL